MSEVESDIENDGIRTPSRKMAPSPVRTYGLSARHYMERSRRVPRRYQEPVRRPSPQRVLKTDKVEYIQRSEGRPPVPVRRGSGTQIGDGNPTMHRSASYASSCSSAGSAASRDSRSGRHSRRRSRIPRRVRRAGKASVKMSSRSSSGSRVRSPLPWTPGPPAIYPYPCRCCPGDTTFYESLDAREVHELEKPVHCTECANRYESEHTMLRHRHVAHAREDAWICSRLHPFERAFVNAVAQGEDTQTPSEVYDVCGYCSISCSKTNRKSHVEEAHGGSRCSGLKGIFFRPDDFRQHLIHSHAATLNPFIEQLVERAHNKRAQRLVAREANKLDLERQLAALESGRPLAGLIGANDEEQYPIFRIRLALPIITNAQDAVSPALPPPTHNPDIFSGQDPGWQRSNDPAFTDLGRSAPVQSGSSLLDEDLKSLPHAKELEHIQNGSMDDGRQGSPFDLQASKPEHRICPRALIHAAPSVSNPPPFAVFDTKKDIGVSQCHSENQEAAQSQGNHTPGLRTYHLEGKLVTPLRILTRWCRPTPRMNYSRLEWRCRCGQQFWGDFKNEEPEKLHRLVFELQQHGFTVDTTMKTATASVTLGTTTSSQNPATSASNSSPNAGPSTSTAVKTINSVTPSGTLPAVRQKNISAPVLLSSISKPVYLELCINRSSVVTQLGEIIIVDGMGQQLIHTDLELFASIRTKYNSIKRKGLFAILYQPCDLHYVQFGTQLSAQQTDIYQKPEALPPDIEVSENRYHYHECPLTPLPPMPPQTFYQYFRQHAPDCASRSTLFSDRLPKKLGASMTLQNSADKLEFGWGIHIIEGPNKPVLAILVATILALSFAVSVIYDVCTGNADSGFAIGQWMVAMLSAVLSAIYFHLQGQ